MAFVVADIATMSPMPAVHEEMHQWAQQEERKRQEAEQMGGVLGDQKERGNAEEHDEHTVRDLRKSPNRVGRSVAMTPSSTTNPSPISS